MQQSNTIWGQRGELFLIVKTLKWGVNYFLGMCQISTPEL